MGTSLVNKGLDVFNMYINSMADGLISKVQVGIFPPYLATHTSNSDQIHFINRGSLLRLGRKSSPI
jgi:hypothetical protein